MGSSLTSNQRAPATIDPKDTVAMRASLAREVLQRARKKTMAFDGVYRDELLAMSPDEVVERFLEIVKKRQGAPAAEALDQEIKRQQLEEEQAERAERERSEAASAAAKAQREKEKTEKIAALPAKPRPAPAPGVALDLTQMPLEGAARAQVKGEIFHQAAKEVPPKASDTNANGLQKPKRLGINPKAMSKLAKLDRRAAAAAADQEPTNTVASNGMRLVRT